MIQVVHFGRAYKRLLYFFLIWTSVCFVAFRVTFNPSTQQPGNNNINSNSNNGQLGRNNYMSILSWNEYGNGASSVNGQSVEIIDSNGHPFDANENTYHLMSGNVNNNNKNNARSVVYGVDSSAGNPGQGDSSVNINDSNQQSDKNILSNNSSAIHVDTNKSGNEDDVLASIPSSSNLPFQYWMRVLKNMSKMKYKSRPTICKTEYPSLFELQYNNIYWQKYSSSNGTFYLYGAYFDDRWRGGPLPSVRILAMIDRISPPPVACLMWFDSISVPLISPVTYIYGWYKKWGNYADGHLQPYVMTCKVPRIKGLPKNLVPSSITIVENKCEKFTNNLKVINNRPVKREKFAVCVKGLDFLYEDLSVRLVEWLELLRLLGASKIFLYDLEVHPNISKVLNYYKKDGLVEVTPITLPGDQPNLPGFRHLYLKKKLTHKRQNELIPYNDCLYRNLYSYDYIALLDIDEIIMPLTHDTWHDMMAQVENTSQSEKNYSRASYNVRNVYFLDDLAGESDLTSHGPSSSSASLSSASASASASSSSSSVNGSPPVGSASSLSSSSSTSDINSQSMFVSHEAGIPKYLHMLQHVYRSANYTKPGQYVKCFHNTQRVVSLHNHFPLNCFGRCTTYSIGTDIAQLQHYRKDCVGPLRKTCKDFRVNTIRDTTIWRYKDDMIHNCHKILTILGFLDF